VMIPPGIEDGAALRVPGRGRPSRDPHGEDGDLFVVVRAEPDERFERRGADLWRTETITVPDAALGTTLRIPTLGSPVRIRVKPGVQPGTVIGLAGKGLPVFQGTGHGDLYVRHGGEHAAVAVFRGARAVRTAARAH